MSVAVRVMCSDGLQNGERSSPPGSRGKALSLKGRTAQIINGKLVLVEAGANGNDNILQGDTTPSSVLVQPVSAAPEEQVEETPVASTSRASTSSANGKASSIRPKLPRRQTRYFCTWEGCVKSYAKPVRLEEHLRSHTGERPYICTHEGCGASYLRDTHLVAHVRTHLDEKDKPFTCEEDGCGKKFWTNQHLNRHVKLVHEQNSGAYKCEQCNAGFNKHNKLREHIVKEHMPEGTKPFFCPVEGCGKSFQTSSTLRTHSKLHDENRYVCMHPSHLARIDHGSSAVEQEVNGHAEDGEKIEDNHFPRFSTWSALQEHNKLEHPPTCPHAECHGRTFKSNKKLRKHCIKFHLDTLPQSEEECTAEEDEDMANANPGSSQANENEKSAQPLCARSGQNGQDLETTAMTDDSGPSGIDEDLSRPDHTGEDTSIVPSYFGGRHRKRKSPGSRDSQLITTQPAVFQDFDGMDDYAEPVVSGSDGEDSETLAYNKRVRFA